eukprot:7723449-Alexandrium_andersonii.AAC.1
MSLPAVAELAAGLWEGPQYPCGEPDTEGFTPLGPLTRNSTDYERLRATHPHIDPPRPKPRLRSQRPGRPVVRVATANVLTLDATAGVGPHDRAADPGKPTGRLK